MKFSSLLKFIETKLTNQKPLCWQMKILSTPEYRRPPSLINFSRTILLLPDARYPYITVPTSFIHNIFIVQNKHGEEYLDLFSGHKKHLYCNKIRYLEVDELKLDNWTIFYW